jgi:SAM-dependent methyltransferase
LSENVSSAWYADFFTELPNEFWRRAVPPEATEADVAFVQRHLDLHPGSRVLDVPCGSGRHALALAARGHRVTGIDISEEAVAHATRRAAGLDVRFAVAEMRTIPQDGSYDAVVCLGNSFAYLDARGVREFVGAMAGALRPGGGVVVDFNSAAESVLPGHRGEPRTMHAGDITVVATSEYDVGRGCLVSRYHFTRGEEELRSTALHHVYTTAHVIGMLTDGGFTGIETYGGPDDGPYEVGSGRLMLTARLRTSAVDGPDYRTIR